MVLLDAKSYRKDLSETAGMLTKAYDNTIIYNKSNSCVPPGFSDYETLHCYKLLLMLELKELCTTWVLDED